MSNIASKKKGYGDAIVQGINEVKTKYFCIFNADGSFDPKELSNMMKLIQNKSLDIIFASRYEKIVVVMMIQLLLI